MTTHRNVIVKQLPKSLDLLQSRLFLHDLAPIFKGDEICLVFDFSGVRRIDSAGVEMLLQCMEAVMKKDGDVKLAALPPEVAVVLELTRVNRLFEVFATVEDAVESYHGFQPDAMLVDPTIWGNSTAETSDGFDTAAA